jgi:hypothetical protein
VREEPSWFTSCARWRLRAPGKEHPTPTTRTPSVVPHLSLTCCHALRPVESRTRLRPRDFELPAPVRHDLFGGAPSKGAVDSFVTRSGSRDSILRGFDAAFSGITMELRPRCVRPTSAIHTSEPSTHAVRPAIGASKLSPRAMPSLAKRLSDVWRVSRRPTRFGDSSHRARRRRVIPAKTRRAIRL